MLRAIIIIIGYLIGLIIGFSIVNIIKKQRLRKLNLKIKKLINNVIIEYLGLKNLKQEHTM